MIFCTNLVIYILMLMKVLVLVNLVVAYYLGYQLELIWWE